MANIREFKTPALDIRPSEIGVEATAAAARRGGAFYNQAAGDMAGLGHELGSSVREAGDVAVKYMEHQEVSHGAVGMTGLIAGKTQEWDQIAKTANPNDPTIQQRFLKENLEPALDKFRGDFMTEGGQKWAEQHVDQFRQHMFTKTSADMATRAADAVSTNVHTMTNAWANTAYKDPSSVQFLLNNSDSTIKGIVDSSPNLRGAAAAKVSTEVSQNVKEQIVKAGYYGAITNSADPEKVAKEWSARYPELITPEEINTFARAAKAQAKANLLTDKQIEQDNHVQAERKADATLSQNWTDNVSFDENGRATIKPDYFKNLLKIEQQYPGARTQRVEAMVNWGQHQQQQKREAIVTDPTVKASLYNGLFDPDHPTTDVEINKANVEGKLSSHDHAALINLYGSLEQRPLRNPDVVNKMKAVRAQLTTQIPGMPGHDPAGETAYAEFSAAFTKEYLKRSKDNTLQPDDLSLNNENSLIRKVLANYWRSPQQKMDSFFAQFGGYSIPGVTPPPAAGAAAPKPVVTTLPPVSERKKDTVYPTAQGPMKWTGTGWVKP